MPKKQKDGRYRAKIVPFPGQKPVWLSARTVRALEQKKQVIRSKRSADVLSHHDFTFHETVIEWFDAIKKPRIKTRSTLANYRNAINLHILPCFSETQLLRGICRADLQRCLDSCNNLSRTTARLVRSILANVMKYAVSEKRIPDDPSVSLFLPPCKEPAQKNAFTPAQTSALLKTAASCADGLMIFLLYYTGVRRGEMLGLMWGDIDWKQGLIHVQRSVDLASATFSTLKSAAANRFIPMADPLAALLQHGRDRPPDVLIVSNRCVPYTEAEFRLRWNRLMIEAGQAILSPSYIARAEAAKTSGKPIAPPHPSRDYLVRVTPHWFRHHFITQCVSAGLSSETTMKIAGHSSYQTTVNIYTHLQTQQLKTAFEQLNAFL